MASAIMVASSSAAAVMPRTAFTPSASKLGSSSNGLASSVKPFVAKRSVMKQAKRAAKIVSMAAVADDRVPDMNKRVTMNLLLVGALALPTAGLLGPYVYFFVPPSSGSAGGGVVAKDALGNDVTISSWTKTHLAGDKSLVQGLKGDPTYLSVKEDLSIAIWSLFSSFTTSIATSRRWQEVERLRAERNVVANKMKGKLEPSVRQALVQEGKNLKERLVSLEEELINITDDLQLEAQCIPNITHPAVPIGGEENSVQRKLVGSPREFGFKIKDHIQIGRDLDLFDFDAAAEVSGSKFYYLKNEAVLLEMALVNWALSEVSKKGFTPLITPELVRSSVVEKCGFQPRGQNTQVYSIEGSDQCLIGTAEIPVGGIHMDSIIPDSSLPLKYVAYSHCFRTEAGAAGTATRGLYRVHQFSKVEMFILCRPEDSDRFHEELIGIEEELFASLGLHFKTLEMASEDLGAPAYRKFDVEAWMPGLGRYGEISSASNCTDYQSRRLGIRYRPSLSVDQDSASAKKGKGTSTAPTQFVHTLNATACAVPRMILCLLESFQQKDGSVLIPEPLRPFMGGLSVISPKSR